MTPSGLPIDACLPAIRRALLDTGDVVIVAPPGAGKTTIVPLELIEAPWAEGKRIMVLEPRRLATRAAARRMSDLVGDEVGGFVGYVTRDERRIGDRTVIEVVTEGVLTRRLQNDPALEGYAAVVFDEVHERNLQTDLGLALAIETRRVFRPDLRLVAMSATIDADRFAALLAKSRDGGPLPEIVRAEVEPHPLEIRWVPKPAKDRIEPTMVAVTMRAVRESDGDILAFLPGAAEIGRVESLIREAIDADPITRDGVDVYPLFGMLPITEQDRALAPSPPGRRRIVLSTDIAETSLTVEGVRIVVDAGLARVPRFDARTGLTKLRTVTASKANADQRAGRAARRGPGVAYRLWSKGEHAARLRNLPAEITEVDLTAFALELATWGTKAADLALIDAPPRRALQEADALLTMLGLIDERGRPTERGFAAARLPVHPRLGRMLAAAGPDPDERWIACCLATLVEERDVLRGRSDEIPADVLTRLDVLERGAGSHSMADRRAVSTVEQRARDLARRIGASRRDLRAAHAARHAGRLLALAYPDRLAIARTQPGRFQLRSGAGAWVAPGDALAHDRFVVAADLDGDRREARIRLGAPLDPADVVELFADQIDERVSTDWDKERDELVERVERRLGGMVIDSVVRRPEANESLVAALVERVRTDGVAILPWTTGATQLADRVRFLHRTLGDPWPDWSAAAMVDELQEWLPPFLVGARGRDALDRLDVAQVLRSRLDPRLPGELDRLAPSSLRLGSREVAINYSGDMPMVAAKVQDFFGLRTHPAIVDGAIRLVVQLLSPAGRPVQVTSDLPGFWDGSWAEVRKEMAGRYPKHAWPKDPHSGGRR